MPDLSRHTRTLLVAALLAASTLAACGGDDENDGTQSAATAPAPDVTQPPDPATTTDQNTTETQPSTTPKPKNPAAKVYKVNEPPRSLRVGGLKVGVEVDSVLDPVTADVDEPLEGNRFVGVFLNTQASGSYEPAKVTAIASLSTKSGNSYPVRIISGGECEGGFFPAGFVLRSKKPRTGCIGFDIPKKEKPTAIVLGVRSTTTGKVDSATWTLPAAQ